MFSTRIRTLADTSLLATAIGLSALAAASTANAAPVHPPQYGTDTCYAYSTQAFYDCFDPS